MRKKGEKMNQYQKEYGEKMKNNITNEKKKMREYQKNYKKNISDEKKH